MMTHPLCPPPRKQGGGLMALKGPALTEEEL